MNKLNRLFHGQMEKRAGLIVEGAKDGFTKDEVSKKLRGMIPKVLKSLEITDGSFLEYTVHKKEFIQVEETPEYAVTNTSGLFVSENKYYLILGKEGIELSFQGVPFTETELYKKSGNLLYLGENFVEKYNSTVSNFFYVNRGKRVVTSKTLQGFLDNVEDTIIQTFTREFLVKSKRGSYSIEDFMKDIRKTYADNVCLQNGDKVEILNLEDVIYDSSDLIDKETNGRMNHKRYYSYGINVDVLKFKYGSEVYDYSGKKIGRASRTIAGVYDTYFGKFMSGYEYGKWYLPSKFMDICGEDAKKLLGNIQPLSSSYSKEKFFQEIIKVILSNSSTKYGDVVEILNPEEFFIRDFYGRGTPSSDVWSLGVDFRKLSIKVGGKIVSYPKDSDSYKDSPMVCGKYNKVDMSFTSGFYNVFSSDIFFNKSLRIFLQGTFEKDLDIKISPDVIYVLRLGTQNTSLIDNNAANLDGEAQFIENYFGDLDENRGQYITMFKVHNYSGKYGPYEKLNGSSKKDPNRTHTPEPFSDKYIGMELSNLGWGYGRGKGKWFSFPKDGAWEAEKISVVPFSEVKDLAYKLKGEIEGTGKSMAVSYDFLGALKLTFPNYKEYD